MNKENIFFVIYMTIEGILGKTRFESLLNLAFQIALKCASKVVSKIKELV